MQSLHRYFGLAWFVACSFQFREIIVLSFMLQYSIYFLVVIKAESVSVRTAMPYSWTQWMDSVEQHTETPKWVHMSSICSVDIKTKGRISFKWGLLVTIASFNNGTLSYNYSVAHRRKREENRAGRRSGGTGAACRVCAVPSHSMISMGDSLSRSLGVYRHPVNASQETRAELTALLPPARPKTCKEKNWGKL